MPSRYSTGARGRISKALPIIFDFSGRRWWRVFENDKKVHFNMPYMYGLMQDSDFAVNRMKQELKGADGTFFYVS